MVLSRSTNGVPGEFSTSGAAHDSPAQPDFDRLAEPVFRQSVIDLFHYLYYNNRKRTWQNTYWMGVRVSKTPLDLWIYQEILWDVRPDVIIETGTLHGGSALYLASVCDLMNHGRIYTVDVMPRPGRPAHHRIEYIEGSSISGEVQEYLRTRIGPSEKVLVILDSDHASDHVLAELRIYSRFVTTGSYLIVEDTNVNGHPVFVDHGPGPMEAVDEFLRGNDDLTVDEAREKFFVSFNPRGYLRRVGNERIQSDPVPGLTEKQSLGDVLRLRDERIAALHAELRKLREENAREAAWLRESLAQKDGDLARLSGSLSKLNATEERLKCTNEEIERIHASKLWRFGSLYWSARHWLGRFLGHR